MNNEQNMGKTGALNLGAKGFVIVILSFLSCYMYSALTSDSLNITVGAFGELGLNTNTIYALSSVATICGIVGSVFFGAISENGLLIVLDEEQAEAARLDELGAVAL